MTSTTGTTTIAGLDRFGVLDRIAAQIEATGVLALDLESSTLHDDTDLLLADFVDTLYDDYEAYVRPTLGTNQVVREVFETALTIKSVEILHNLLADIDILDDNADRDEVVESIFFAAGAYANLAIELGVVSGPPVYVFGDEVESRIDSALIRLGLDTDDEDEDVTEDLAHAAVEPAESGVEDGVVIPNRLALALTVVPGLADALNRVVEVVEGYVLGGTSYEPFDILGTDDSGDDEVFGPADVDDEPVTEDTLAPEDQVAALFRSLGFEIIDSGSLRV